MLAVWAFNQRGTLGGDKYGRTHRALANHNGFLKSADLVIGDFNDNVLWDTGTRPSFRTTSTILEGHGHENLYYAQTGEVPANESVGTLYFHRHDDEPFFIDHAFQPYSDHVPLIVDLEP